MRRDESGDVMPQAAVAAPVAQVNFKVIDYGAMKNNNDPVYAQNGTLAGAHSGIHMGMMNDNNKDD